MSRSNERNQTGHDALHPLPSATKPTQHSHDALRPREEAPPTAEVIAARGAMRFAIYTPNTGFRGERGGVKFLDGVGRTDHPTVAHSLLEFGYSVHDTEHDEWHPSKPKFVSDAEDAAKQANDQATQQAERAEKETADRNAQIAGAPTGVEKAPATEAAPAADGAQGDNAAANAQ